MAVSVSSEWSTVAGPVLLLSFSFNSGSDNDDVTLDETRMMQQLKALNSFEKY